MKKFYARKKVLPFVLNPPQIYYLPKKKNNKKTVSQQSVEHKQWQIEINIHRRCRPVAYDVTHTTHSPQ